jgi:hypothetical protein
MDEDILEKVRSLALFADEQGWRGPAATLYEAEAEIERLRGGWTRLGLAHFPPSDGTPFELRRDGDPRPHFLTRIYTGLSEEGFPTFHIRGFCLDAEHFTMKGVPYFICSSINDREITHGQGWWRLMQSGEPPHD